MINLKHFYGAIVISIRESEVLNETNQPTQAKQK